MANAIQTPSPLRYQLFLLVFLLCTHLVVPHYCRDEYYPLLVPLYTYCHHLKQLHALYGLTFALSNFEYALASILYSNNVATLASTSP